MRINDENKDVTLQNNVDEKIISSSDIQSFGELKIHENVIASLVRRATVSQKGISRLSGNNFVDTIGEIVGSRRIQDRAIFVKLCDDNRIEIEVKVVVLCGYVIPDVALAVQKSVISEVEKVTGMIVTAVNVTVQDVEDMAAEDDESEE